MATGTQIEVVMPQMGVSVSEGTVTKWLKQPGDAIVRDEALLEISTDKVDTEIPSPGDGVVGELLVAEGDTVEVGTLLATILPVGAVAMEAPPAPEPVAEPVAAIAEPVPAAPEPPVAAAPEQPAATPVAADAASGNGRTFVSPVVARIASEHGVDPNTVAGTGTGGRVTKKDILAHIEAGGPAPAAPEPTASPAVAPLPAAAPPVAPVAPAAPVAPVAPVTAAGRSPGRSGAARRACPPWSRCRQARPRSR